MSNYLIYGRECSFAGIPFATLEDYGPKQYTHLLAWKAPQAEDTLLILLWLRMLSKLQAIDRLKTYDIEQGRIAALFDYRGDSHLTSHMDILERYLGQICGTNYILRCPFRIAMHQEGVDMMKKALETDTFILDIYNTQPHLREKLLETQRLNEQWECVCGDIMAATDGDHKETPKGRDGQRRLAQ